MSLLDVSVESPPSPIGFVPIIKKGNIRVTTKLQATAKIQK
jgi:hypothetical protein